MAEAACFAHLPTDQARSSPRTSHFGAMPRAGVFNRPVESWGEDPCVHFHIFASAPGSLSIIEQAAYREAMNIGRTHNERTAYLLAALAVFLYVIVRAIVVPMVHDECASAIWYAQAGEWLPYRSHWDTNNHFTNSGSGVLFHHLFGMHAWALRLGSVIAFVIYAWAAWRLGGHIRERVVRWCMWSAMLLCPFMLDFFSMFRGYSFEMAAWTLALDLMIRYATSRSSKHLIVALAALFFASASSIVLVPTWALALVLLVCLFVLFWKRLSIPERIVQMLSFATLGAGPFWYVANVVLYFKEHEALTYGTSKGFVIGTVGSITPLLLGSAHQTVVAGVVALMIISTLICVLTIRKNQVFGSPFILITLLLWADVVTRMVMARVLGANFPADRTGMYYIPLALLSIAFAADALAQRRSGWKWSAGVLLFLPLRTLATANLDHTFIWPEQSIPERFATRVLDEERRLGRSPVIGGPAQFELCWPLDAQMEGRIVPLLQPADLWRDLGDLYDLRIIDRRFPPEDLSQYHAIDSAKGPGLSLWQRNEPLKCVPVDTIITGAKTGTDEFYEFAHIPCGSAYREDILLDVKVPITVHNAPPDLQVVLELRDSLDGKMFFAGEPLRAQRAEWDGETFHFARSFPATTPAFHIVLYVFNHRRVTVALGEARTVVYRVVR